MAPSLEVLSIQAAQIRNQVNELRHHITGHQELADDVALLTAVDVLFGSICAGLRLAASPALRAEIRTKLDRDAEERRRNQEASDPRA